MNLIYFSPKYRLLSSLCEWFSISALQSDAADNCSCDAAEEISNIYIAATIAVVDRNIEICPCAFTRLM
jgi:hypothetical protein